MCPSCISIPAWYGSWLQTLQSGQMMQERVTQLLTQLSSSQDEVSQLREKTQVLSQQVVKMDSHTIKVNMHVQTLMKCRF